MSTPTPSFEQAIELVYAVHRAVVAEPDRLLARRGLGRVHHRILYAIGRSPGLTIGALCFVLGVSKQALHGPLAALEKAGLIERTVGLSRRERCVTLTRRGTTFTAQLTAGQRERLEHAFREAGPDAAAAWETVMRRLC